MNLKSINTPAVRHLGGKFVPVIVGFPLLFTLDNMVMWSAIYYAVIALVWGVNRLLAAKYGRHASAAAAARIAPTAQPAQFTSAS